MRTSLLCIALFSVAACLARADDAETLFQKAKQELQPGHNGSQKAIPLLSQANALWEKQSSQSSDYAESLDLLALLLRSQALKNAPVAARRLCGSERMEFRGFTSHQASSGNS